MFNHISWRFLLRLSSGLHGLQKRKAPRRERGFRVRLEELESRLAPASFAVNAQLQISRLDDQGDTPAGTHAVVFYESAVTNYEVLRQGLSAGTDAVLLDSGGDGLREMAAFLASRHNLTSIGVVAHGAPGAVTLGTATLNVQDVSGYARELATIGSALGRAGELDLWSCDVAAGQGGTVLVRDLAVATGTGVAAADHAIGSAEAGGNWQLDVRVAGARGGIPFSVNAIGGFHELLGTWSATSSMATARIGQTATLLPSGKVLVVGGQGISGVLSSAELYDPVTNTWSAAGSMATARKYHTATLLSNGQVLVAGGSSSFNPDGDLSSAELYDAVSNTWSAAASLPAARGSHTATLLSNGRVLVAGGWSAGSGGRTAALYDPVSNTWSATGAMTLFRVNHTATLLTSGKVLVAGGETSTSELYDPATNIWSAAGSMAQGRFLHTATLLASGQVLVTGGIAAGSSPALSLSSSEIYDPVSNTWSPAGSMVTGRALHTATLLKDGQLLVTGGEDYTVTADTILSSAELYHPISNTWSSAGSMATARAYDTATLLSNGKVLVAGGFDGTNKLSSAALYDPGLWNPPGAWKAAPSMATARWTHTATLLGNGKVLVAGGFDGNNYLSSAQLYDPVSNTWSSAASMATGRDQHTATLLGNGQVLITGGFDGANLLSSAELYDPVTNTWSAAASMATARWFCTATLLGNGQVLVAGGFGAGGALSSAELYNPVTNTWSAAASMATARSNHTATLLGNGKVLVTGGLGTTGDLSSAELYDPVSNTWSAAGSMATARVLHTATLLANGKVLVAGGQGNTNLSSAELYDPVSNTWSPAGSMATRRYYATMTLLGNGQVLVAGGKNGSPLSNSSAELYNPVSNTWSTAGSMATARHQHTATLLGNGQVLVAGGANGGPLLSSAELYDPAGAVTVAPASQLAITNLSAASITAGGSVSFTVTAEDSAGQAVPSYTGTVRLTSSDGQAGLPATYTFLGSDAGTHMFTVTLATAGNQTITVTDQNLASLHVATGPISVSSGALNEFVVSALGGNTVTAGSAFLVTVQTADQFGNPLSSFTGPVTFTTTDPQVAALAGATVANGFGVTVGTLKTVAGGPWTISATAGTLKGTSSSLTVTPANAVYFTVSAPPIAVTGSPINNITVKAFDPFQNLATGYTGKVHFSSSDAKATLPADATLTGGIGTLAVTLNTAGSQTITASDAVSSSPITILGTSAPIATAGLTVTALTNTPTGFTATFNKGLNPADLTIYGTGGTVQDVLLVGKTSNNGQPYPGTLIVDPTNKLVTFNVSANFLAASNLGGSAALPDDTYTVTLLSGSGNNGFQDVAGQGLDDGHGGHADYVGTFTTSYQKNKTQVLGITDFARGPNASGDTTTLVKVPNDQANGGHIGIPITIYNAVNLTSAGFTLTYNANILTVTGGISDPSNASATFQMTSNVMSADGVHAVAVFAFTSATPQSGTQILGDVTAYVPYSARGQYQVKDLLALGAIAVNGGATVVPGNAVDVNAYFGDVNGDHHLDGLDKGLIANVASTLSSGFSAFTLLDPAIIGDLSGDNAVTSNSTSLLSNYLLALPVAKIPALPNPPIADNLFTSPFAFDPTLSLPAMVQASPNGVVNVPVFLDHPRPEGSTGLVEAELTLTYDPAVLSVSAADITLGSIPSQGAGWQLAAMVNAASGQITIQLYSQTPITTDQAGSLMNIAFHIKSSAGRAGKTTVRLVDSQTVLADAQAAMILSPGLDWTAVLIGI